MRFCWVSYLAWASVLSMEVCWSKATPLPFSTAPESSGDQELDVTVTTPSAVTSLVHMLPLQSTPWVLSPTPPTDGPGVEHFLLEQMRSFLQENLVPVLLVVSLMVAGIFLVCCASVMSRQRKFAAYYPSSFPATCYVDQRDKAGGEPAFHHVPNRPPDVQTTEPLDSAHQLQQDILTAARKLRTPTKAPKGGRGTPTPELGPAEVQQSQQDTLQSEDKPIEMGKEVITTEKKQDVTPRETEKQMPPTETEQKAPSTETEQEVSPTETDQEVTPTGTEQEMTPTVIEQEVPPTVTEQEVTPTEAEQEMTPTVIEQEVAPTEAEQEVPPIEIEREVSPSETELESSPTVIEQEVPPTETDLVVTPTETEQEVPPTEIEQEVILPETDHEVKESLQETDQSVESEEMSGANMEPGAQQELRSSPAETHELPASSVKLICGETTAF